MDAFDVEADEGAHTTAYGQAECVVGLGSRCNDDGDQKSWMAGELIVEGAGYCSYHAYILSAYTLSVFYKVITLPRIIGSVATWVSIPPSRFCSGACLHLGVVSVSQDLTTRGFNMEIKDGSTSATVPRGPIW